VTTGEFLRNREKKIDGVEGAEALRRVRPQVFGLWLRPYAIASARVVRIQQRAHSLWGLGAALFLGAAALAFHYLRVHGWGFFYQNEFGPAVSFACTGHFTNLGFLTSEYDPSPDLIALRDFLYSKKGIFDCAALPPDAAVGRQPLDMAQSQNFYILVAAGVLWSIFGISWSVLYILGALLAGVFCLSIYGFARLFVAWPYAVAAAVLATVSPTHLAMLPQLRDYAKAPMLVAFMFAAGKFVLAEDRRRALFFAAFAGGVAGIGFGVRADLALAVPFFGAIVLLRVLLRYQVGTTGYALLLFAAAWIVAALPTTLTGGYPWGGQMGHVALIGITNYYTEQLQLNVPLYDLGWVTGVDSDRLIFHFVHGANQFDRMFHQGTAEYARASNAALAAMYLQFPADVILKALSALTAILAVDFTWLVKLPARWLSTGLFEIVGFTALFLALTISFAARPAAGLFLGGVVAFFCGACAIQFDFRHGFYLQFLFWICIAIIVAFLVDAMRRRSDRIRNLAAGLVFATVSVALAMVALVGAQMYQDRTTSALMERYIKAPRVPVTTIDEARDQQTLVRVTGKIPSLGGQLLDVESAAFGEFYLVASIEAEKCEGDNIDLTFIGKQGFNTLSVTRTIKVPLGRNSKEPYRIFFPMFHCQGECAPYYHTRLLGIAVPKNQRRCLSSIEAWSDHQHAVLPIWLRVPPNFRDAPGRHQTRQHWIGEGLLAVSRREDKVAEERIADDSWQTVPPAIIERGVIRLQGRPSGPYLYGALSTPFSLNKGTRIVARVTVFHGGVTFGVIDATGVWREKVNLARGTSAAELTIPSDGHFRIVIANDLTPWQASNNALIEDVRIVGRLQ